MHRPLGELRVQAASRFQVSALARPRRRLYRERNLVRREAGEEE